jgi:hypothetical protein
MPAFLITCVAEIPAPEWLLDNGWPVAATLVCAFAILRMLGSQFGKKRMLQASWACLGILAILLAARLVIETTDQKLERQTRELAESCIGPNLEKFNRLADGEIKVTLRDPGRVALRGPQVRTALQVAGVRSVSCSALEVIRREGDPLVGVQVSVSGDTAKWHGWGLTTWEVYWQKTPHGWRAVEMRLINVPGGPGVIGSLHIPH